MSYEGFSHVDMTTVIASYTVDVKDSMLTDPYRVLSIQVSATREQICDRYSLLLLLNAGEHEAQSLKDAYEHLMDPERRSAFDDATQLARDRQEEQARAMQEQEQREQREREAQQVRNWVVRGTTDGQGRGPRQFRGRQRTEERERLITGPWAEAPSNSSWRTYGTTNAGDDPPPSYASRPPSYTSRPPSYRERTPPPTRNPTARTPLLPPHNIRKKRNTNSDLGSCCLCFLLFCFGVCISIAVILGVVALVRGIVHWATEPPYERRIAIIGAGPAGVSTAYHLSKRADRSNIPHRITIYDKQSHIGGRSVRPAKVFDESIELGATIFPKAATILISAADNLGLATTAVQDGVGDLVGQGSGAFGVYDGRSWAYLESHPRNFFERGWWNFSLWVRYGNSPARAQNIVSDFRRKRAWLQSSIPFSAISSALSSVRLSNHATETAEHHISSRGVSKAFQREIFNPWVRARYAQNLGTISALGALIAADNGAALTVTKGLVALWERMVSSSGATVRLETDVLSLSKGSWGGWFVASASPSGKKTVDRFDAVVLATPWGLTSPTLHQNLTAPHNHVAYAGQHITLFTSPDRLSSHQFHGEKNIPGIILSTPCSWEYTAVSGLTGVRGVGHAPFWVLSRLKEVVYQNRRQYLYKVISAEEMPDEKIHRLVTGNGKATWIYRDFSPTAHPLLVPRSVFSNILLDDHLWYTGVMDELATGVDMGALMGDNVAALVVKQWKAEGKYLSEEKRIPSEEGKGSEGPKTGDNGT